MGNKTLTCHIHFQPNEGMQEDKLKCHNFVAVTLKVFITNPHLLHLQTAKASFGWGTVFFYL